MPRSVKRRPDDARDICFETVPLFLFKGGAEPVNASVAIFGLAPCLRGNKGGVVVAARSLPGASPVPGALTNS